MSAEKPIMLRLRSKVVKEALRVEADRRGLPNVQPIIEEWLTQYVLGQAQRPAPVVVSVPEPGQPGQRTAAPSTADEGGWGWQE